MQACQVIDWPEPIHFDPERFFRTEHELPPLPAIAVRIQEMIEADEASAGEISKLVTKDPALVAQVLRMVNSAYYGLPREVGNLKFAIAFVGLGAIYRIVIALSVVDALRTTDPKQMQEFWFGSYLSTLIAKFVAIRFAPHVPLEDLWPAALLHDIGQLVYAKFFPTQLASLRNYSRQMGCLRSEAEQALGLPASARFGALLCEHWQLPRKIRVACESQRIETLDDLQHDGSLLGDFRRTICVGHLLGEMSTQELNSQLQHRIVESVTSSLGCDQARYLDLMAGIYGLREEVGAFIRDLH